jgi:hypothetical protein
VIICVICQHKNLDGMMFCENCGTQIAGLPLDTYAIKPDPIKATMNISSEGVHKPGGLETWASLHLIETGHILPLGDKSEFTLGRVSDNQAIMPDIDLTPYQAFANGVSRIHAVIKRNDKRVSVMDLGSSNGTYMNNERITPNVEIPIGHNDLLSLGKLKIQILLNF